VFNGFKSAYYVTKLSVSLLRFRAPLQRVKTPGLRHVLQNIGFLNLIYGSAIRRCAPCEPGQQHWQQHRRWNPTKGKNVKRTIAP
jgi:RNA polymerase-interacting CarD/CdnL/TRCF family regulator